LRPSRVDNLPPATFAIGGYQSQRPPCSVHSAWGPYLSLPVWIDRAIDPANPRSLLHRDPRTELGTSLYTRMWHTDPCRQSLRGGVRYVRTNHTVPITKRDLHVCFGSPRDEESYGSEVTGVERRDCGRLIEYWTKTEYNNWRSWKS
jgi:hypothetical protein